MSREPTKKIGTSITGEPMHYSAGVIVRNGPHILILNRMHPPLGWACPAGHVDEGESPRDTAIRELREETGIVVQEVKLVWEEEVLGNRCRSGSVHYWYVYTAATDQTELVPNTEEVRRIRWMLPSEIRSLYLEAVWERWLLNKELLQLAMR